MLALMECIVSRTKGEGAVVVVDRTTDERATTHELSMLFDDENKGREGHLLAVKEERGIMLVDDGNGLDEELIAGDEEAKDLVIAEAGKEKSEEDEEEKDNEEEEDKVS
ncbi:MAG: hypothetical protein Q9168_007982, partial [Polycauliona sp. 1 TL-2023]